MRRGFRQSLSFSFSDFPTFATDSTTRSGETLERLLRRVRVAYPGGGGFAVGSRGFPAGTVPAGVLMRGTFGVLIPCSRYGDGRSGGGGVQAVREVAGRCPRQPI